MGINTDVVSIGVGFSKYRAIGYLTVLTATLLVQCCVCRL